MRWNNLATVWLTDDEPLHFDEHDLAWIDETGLHYYPGEGQPRRHIPMHRITGWEYQL